MSESDNIIPSNPEVTVGADYHPPVSPIVPVVQLAADLPPHKKLPLFVVLLIALLVAISVFAIYLLIQVRSLTLSKLPPLPSPTPLVSADPTADWQTYTNSTHGFSLKYPQDWVKTQYLPNSPDVISFQAKSDYDAKSTNHAIVLDMSSNCLNTQCLTAYSLDEMVSNRSATKVDELKLGDVIVYKTALAAGDIAYMFAIDHDFIQISTNDQLELLDTILRTIRFSANQSSSKELLTYSNNNIELKYPKNWKSSTTNQTLESYCQIIEINKSDAIELEISLYDYIKKVGGYSETTDIGDLIKNIPVDLQIKTINIDSKDIGITGPDGEGVINMIYIRGPEGTGYYSINVRYIGPSPDIEHVCSNEANTQYKEILSSIKFIK